MTAELVEKALELIQEPPVLINMVSRRPDRCTLLHWKRRYRSDGNH